MIGTDQGKFRFEGIYERYGRVVLAYCHRRADAAVAADACAEVFLIAWRRLDEVPMEPKTLPYLYGIAARVLANHRRSERRRERLGSRVASLGFTSEPDTATIVIRRFEDVQVIEAVRRLSPRDREIVMLYTWEDLPRETIADMMGMTKAAVDQRIHRSYKRLASALRHGAATKAIQPPLVAEEGKGR